MRYGTIGLLSAFLVLLFGCNNQSSQTMQSLQSKSNEEVNYADGDISIQMDTEHSLIRLAEYTTDPQGNSYPKTKVKLRTHDVLYLPYKAQIENVAVEEDNTISLSDVIDPSQLHPEAIGVQLAIHTSLETVKTSVFDKDLKKALAQNSLKIKVISEQTLELLAQQSADTPQKQRFQSVAVFAREILPASQGQTFNNITLPEKAILDFSMSYAPLPMASEEPIPLTFTVSVTSSSGTTILYNNELAANHPDLRDITQGWVNQSVDLSKFSGQEVSIRLSTSMEATHIPLKQANNLSVGLWGSPVIYTPRSALPKAKPNVIFISLDTLRADHLGSYGYDLDTSPHIDAFAKEALLFEKCIATSSWTLPTHASIFTGLHPAIHGSNGIEKWRLSDSYETLAEVLHDANYTTAAFTDGAVIAAAKGFSQGFDLYSDGVLFQRPRPAGTIKLIVDQTINWLDSHQEAPFFLFMHTYEIHDVYQPPEPYLGKFGPPEPAKIYPTDRGEFKGNMPSKEDAHLAIARYDEGIAYTDNELQRLFSYLEKSGLTDNTIIVLFSDHGEEFYDHGTFTHGRNLYSEVLHVPLIIRMPGTTAPTGRISRAVSQLDLFSTITEALDIDYTPPRNSYSLMPLINDSADDEEYTRSYLPGHLLTRRDFRSIPFDEDGLIGKLLLSVEDENYKYILSTKVWDEGSPLQEAWDTHGLARDTSLERQLSDALPVEPGIIQELYFLPDDFKEQNNRAQEHPEIIEKMRQLLLKSLEDAKLTATIDVSEEEEEAPLTDDEREALEALGYLE